MKNLAVIPEFEFTVEPYLSGVRVDSFLARHLRNYTTWRLHRMVASGQVEVNQLPAGPTQRVFRGQTVHIRLSEPPDKLLDPEAGLSGIVYEDPWLMVVDKPAGLVAHPVGRFQEGTLTNLVQQHLDQQTQQRGLLRPGIVHRLDRMTSGLMILTKEHHIHRHLSLAFQQSQIEKSYLALVEGRVSFSEQMVELPIGQHPDGRSVLMSAKSDARRSRAAKTHVRVLQRRQQTTLVQCRLFTGRNHQIRVHLAELGHPVLGDEFYGPFGEIRSEPYKVDQAAASDRHALHAAQLGFRHPVLDVRLTFVSRPPADFYSRDVDSG